MRPLLRSQEDLAADRGSLLDWRRATGTCHWLRRGSPRKDWCLFVTIGPRRITARRRRAKANPAYWGEARRFVCLSSR